MPWFDVVLGMVPDYMHGCLLGVTKTLLYKWFSATNHKHPYFIGGKVLTYFKLYHRLKCIAYLRSVAVSPPEHFEYWLVFELLFKILVVY